MNEIEKTKAEIAELTRKLSRLQRETPLKPVKNYRFTTMEGEVSLLDLFGGKDQLIMIHNMGQGCRYCTLWADGVNAFIPHLESVAAVVIVNKDAPELQREFANSRGWRFRMASHGGGDYIREQATGGMNSENTQANEPGVVAYVRKGNEIYKKNSSGFGPGDLFCSHWHLLSLLGLNEENWFPQFHYWKRPQKLDDGGQNVKE